MHELRVLSGWQRGAGVPLADRPYLIGTDHDCDSMLDDCANGQNWSERKIRAIQLMAAVVMCAIACAAVFKSSASIAETAVHDPTSNTAGLIAQAGGTIGTVRKRDGYTASVPTTALSPEQLRNAFRGRLADAALMQYFELNLGDRLWLMHAVLDDAQMLRFERLLLEFVREYHVRFPFSAKIVSADTTLPFKIQQVISGANASVVMQDGRRMRVGEVYRGVRLLSVKGDRLTFGGKRTIELRW